MLIEIIQNRVDTKVEDLKDFTESEAQGIGFSQYALEKVFQSFTNEEIDAGIVDACFRKGKKDHGIDAIYVTANKEYIDNIDQLKEFNKDTKFEFHILQFKKGNNLDEGTFLKLKEGIENTFIGNVLLEEDNEYMFEKMKILKELRREIFTKFQPRNIKVKCYVVFSGSKELTLSNADFLQIINNTKDLMLKNSYSQVEYEIWGAQELIDAETNFSNISGILNYKQHFKYVTAGENDQKLNGHIALVKADEIGKLVEEWQSALFELNIRDYYRTSSNNAKIVETASDKEEGKYFWSFNNGLTITCKKVDDLPENKLKVEGLQIVNGCQTSNSLFLAYSNLLRSNELNAIKQERELTTLEQKELEEVEKMSLDPNTSLLVKIIETENEELVYKITETTNSQTSITAFSIKANESIHKNIETFFKEHDIFYERRVNFYRNKGVPIKKIVDIKKLAQVFMSVIKFKPAQAMSSPKKLFTSNYEIIFPNPADRPMNYNLYLIPLLVLQTLESKIKVIQRSKSEQDEYNKKIMSYGKFHLTALITSSILKGSYNESTIVKNADLVKKAINNENEFEKHFNNGMESLKSILVQIGAQSAELVSQKLRTTEIETAIARYIKTAPKSKVKNVQAPSKVVK